MALALLCVAQFVVVLDVTIVAVALPTIGADLGRAPLAWSGSSPPTASRSAAS